MEFLGCAVAIFMIAVVIFATKSNIQKQDQINELNGRLEKMLSTPISAKEDTLEGPTIGEPLDINMSLISEPVHKIAQLIIEGETFSIDVGEYDPGYAPYSYEWVDIKHLKNPDQSSAIVFRDNGWCGYYAWDWMEQEELKYLFKISKDNYERLAEKSALEYKTKRRQESIEFYAKASPLHTKCSNVQIK